MNLTDWQITDEGLVIKCTKEESEELNDIVLEKGLSDAEFEVLEHCTCNGLSYVTPEELGALTSATLLTDDEAIYSDFNYYQIRSFVEDLVDNQKAVLHKVSSYK